MNDQNIVRAPIAPPKHIAYAHTLGRGMLTFYQVEELVKAINPAYVETKQGLTYLAQHQARAETNRIFGYGNWDVIAEDPFLLYEFQEQGAGKNAGKMYWKVAYRIRVTVHIRDLWGMPIASFTGVHAEENAPQPNRGEAHALALTSVDSYALRRALINLGDRFGLGLYDSGSRAAHGIYTAQLEPGQLFQWGAGDQPQSAPPQQVAPPQPQPQPQSAAPVQQPMQQPMQPQQQPQQQQQQQPVAQSDVMAEFRQVAAQQQAGRDAARQAVAPDMQARLQQGLKVDEQGGMDNGS